jgi:hypothetical protein
MASRELSRVKRLQLVKEEKAFRALAARVQNLLIQSADLLVDSETSFLTLFSALCAVEALGDGLSGELRETVQRVRTNFETNRVPFALRSKLEEVEARFSL